MHVVELLVKVLINAAALFVAVQVVPQIKFNFGNDWWKLLVVALIFALVNSYIKPIVKALSLPVSLMILGAIVISVVSTLASIALTPRKLL
jgi:putative membrane protein